MVSPLASGRTSRYRIMLQDDGSGIMLPDKRMQKSQSKDEFSGLRCVIYEGIIIERDNFIVLKTCIGRLDAACDGNRGHRGSSRAFDSGSFGLRSSHERADWD